MPIVDPDCFKNCIVIDNDGGKRRLSLNMNCLRNRLLDDKIINACNDTVRKAVDNFAATGNINVGMQQGHTQDDGTGFHIFKPSAGALDCMSTASYSHPGNAPCPAVVLGFHEASIEFECNHDLLGATFVQWGIWTHKSTNAQGAIRESGSHERYGTDVVIRMSLPTLVTVQSVAKGGQVNLVTAPSARVSNGGIVVRGANSSTTLLAIQK